MLVTTTVVDGTGTVTHAASIECAHAVVHVVANAIVVGIGCAVTTTYTQGVELVAIAITVAIGDAVATAFSTFVDRRTAAVVIRGRRIIVACRLQCTTRNF